MHRKLHISDHGKLYFDSAMQFIDEQAEDADAQECSDGLSGKSFLSLLRFGRVSPVLLLPTSAPERSPSVQLSEVGDLRSARAVDSPPPDCEGSGDGGAASDLEPEEIAPALGPRVSDAKFRFNACRVFLTYPQCGPKDVEPGSQDSWSQTIQDPGLTFERIESRLRAIGCYQWVIGRERHRDDGLHFHVFAGSRSRMSTSNCRFFDVGPFHPYIRAVRKTPERVIEYCCKDGDYQLGGGLRLFGTSRDFRRRRADFEAFVAYGRVRSLPSPSWPILLPGGGSLPGYSPGDKKRHGMIYGPASKGKSWWFDCVFGGQAVYAVPKSGHRWDAYELERVVFFDDPEPFPDKGLLTTLCESCHYDRYLPARYNNKLLPAGWWCTVIICCNEDSVGRSFIFDSSGRSVSVSFLDQQWFTERFILDYVQHEYKGTLLYTSTFCSTGCTSIGSTAAAAAELMSPGFHAIPLYVCVGPTLVEK